MSKTHLTEFKEDITDYFDLESTVKNHKMFRIKLYSAIAKAYPHLKEKCDECSEKHLPVTPDEECSEKHIPRTPEQVNFQVY